MNRTLVWAVLGLALLAMVEVTSGKSSDEFDDLKSAEKDNIDKDLEKEEATGESKETRAAKRRGLFNSQKRCQGQKWDRPKALTKAQKKCDAQKAKAKETATELGKKGAICEAVCMWKEASLLIGDELKVDQSAVDDLVELLLPGGLKGGQNLLKKQWKDCKKEIDYDDKDTEDCKKYKKYFKCLLGSFKKHCAFGGKPQGGGGGGGLLSLNLG